MGNLVEEYSKKLLHVKEFRQKNYRRIVEGSLDVKLPYEEMVREVHEVIAGLMGEFSISRLNVMHGGLANYYSGRLEFSGKDCFVKVVHGGVSNESVFYGLVSGNKIPEFGSCYELQKPYVDISGSGFRLYIFPYRDLQEIRSLNENSIVRKLVKALAEFNAVGYKRRKNINRYLPKKRVKVSAVEREYFRECFHSAADAELNKVYSEYLTAVDHVNCASREFWSMKQSLACGDYNVYHNLMLNKGKVLYLDMGQACMAPIGSDMYWLEFYKNKGHMKNVSIDMFSCYQEELKKSGINVSLREILFASRFSYCVKWLNIMLGAPSTRDLEHLKYVIEIAGQLRIER